MKLFSEAAESQDKLRSVSALCWTQGIITDRFRADPHRSSAAPGSAGPWGCPGTGGHWGCPGPGPEQSPVCRRLQPESGDRSQRRTVISESHPEDMDIKRLTCVRSRVRAIWRSEVSIPSLSSP